MIYRLLVTGQPYNETVFARNDALAHERRLSRLHREAATLGFSLNPMGQSLVS